MSLAAETAKKEEEHLILEQKTKELEERQTMLLVAVRVAEENLSAMQEEMKRLEMERE